MSTQIISRSAMTTCFKQSLHSPTLHRRRHWWCNGQHCCLPSSRSGFDSRPMQRKCVPFFFSFPFLSCHCEICFHFLKENIAVCTLWLSHHTHAHTPHTRVSLQAWNALSGSLMFCRSVAPSGVTTIAVHTTGYAVCIIIIISIQHCYLQTFPHNNLSPQ